MSLLLTSKLLLSSRFSVKDSGCARVWWTNACDGPDDPPDWLERLTSIDIDGPRGQKKVCEILAASRDFHAAVIETESTILCCVDHVRSIPLFYCKKTGSVSDEFINLVLSDSEVDWLGEREFEICGYVLGEKTFIEEIRQVPAGQIRVIDRTGPGFKVRQMSYYQFMPVSPLDLADSISEASFLDAIRSAIDFLVQKSCGRQIVVPLSGGFDSRLICTLLRMINYENVLTFSYGDRGDKEVETSRKVARDLGLPWVFVEYSHTAWAAQSVRDELFRYELFASNGSSAPHIQDWLAVKMLVASGHLESNAIFVPGHSGDFVAGSHLPECVFQRTEFRSGNLVDEITAQHLKYGNKNDQALINIRRNINNAVDRDLPGPINSQDFADWFEKWDWEERQAKFIVNSVRVYEYFGFSWWMPLWDPIFTNRWKKLSLKPKQNRWLYKIYVDSIYKKCCGKNSPRNGSDPALILTLFRKIVRGKAGEMLRKMRPFFVKHKVMGMKPYSHQYSYLMATKDPVSTAEFESAGVNPLAAHFRISSVKIKESIDKLKRALA